MSITQMQVRFGVNRVVSLVKSCWNSEEKDDRRHMERLFQSLISPCVGGSIVATVTKTNAKAVSLENELFFRGGARVMSECGLRIGDNAQLSRRRTAYCSYHQLQYSTAD